MWPQWLAFELKSPHTLELIKKGKPTTSVLSLQYCEVNIDCQLVVIVFLEQGERERVHLSFKHYS